jgi:hypothetical protein
MIHHSIGTTRKFATIGVVSLAIALAACGDFTGVPASLPTLSADSATVYAINGAPSGAATALHVFSGTLLAADASFTFDVAFDINSSGQILFLPQRAVASGLATTHAVALQVDSTDTFDSITRAPAGGYRADTAVVARVGQVVLVQVTDPNSCGFSISGTTVFGKLQVRSLDLVNRTMKLRYTVDPNCGFRSFASGVPKD